MAKEKYIRGKRDNGHHDGRFSNRKRFQESEAMFNNWKKEKDERHVNNLRVFTGFWHGIFYWKGQPQVKK